MDPQTTETAPAPPDTTTAAPAPKATGSAATAFRGRVERAKKRRRELIRDWQINIDFRRGKYTNTDSDDDRFPLTVDWAQTKNKIAQLFSQIPQVVATGEGPYKIAAPVVQKALNRRLAQAKVGAALDEGLPDVVNAAGLAGALVSYESREEMRTVPKVPDEALSMMDKVLINLGVKQREMIDQPYITDKKFDVTRISPADLLIPAEFVHSDYDLAPWLGHTGRMTWAQASREFNLTEEQRDQCLGDPRTSQDRLVVQGNTNTMQVDEDVVSFDQVFYWNYLYDPDEPSFTAIHHIVFVNGIDEPVLDEPWKGQELDQESGRYLGACRFPIRILTLDYLTDEASPPSNSSINRPQVKEIMRFRQQITEQRNYSKPLRWYNVDRLDADIQTSLMQGDWQGFIPTQGEGSKVIGEVARALYAQEDFMFEKLQKGDLQEGWGAGPNQSGSIADSGEHSAAEMKITQGNYSTRIGQERARVVAFFLGIADVMLGLMCLYDDFELPNPQDAQRLATWDRKTINHELAFSIRGDATVLLDANQRIERNMRFLNIAGKSGLVNPKPILEQIAADSGLDPMEVLQDPIPKGPEPPNISYRFSGVEDLSDPMVVAMLVKTDQAPKPEEIHAAKLLIAASKEPMVAPVSGPEQPPGGPGAPSPPMADDRPDWQAVDRVNSRRDATQD